MNRTFMIYQLMNWTHHGNNTCHVSLVLLVPSMMQPFGECLLLIRTWRGGILGNIAWVIQV